MKMPLGLHIRLWSDGRPPAIDYHGASVVARLLTGRPVADVADMLGSLFSICPAAQRLAAHKALCAATGASLDTELQQRLTRAARLEMMREHALHIVLGWSARLGEMPDRAIAARLNGVGRTGGMACGVEAVAADAIFGGSQHAWLSITTMAELSAWANSGGSVAARFIADVLNIDDVPCHPAGIAADGLVARHAEHPLIAALQPGTLASFHVARLIDVAMLAQDRISDPDEGAACSRGNLVHRAWQEGEVIVHYEITSPTDLAFGQGGHGRQWLARLTARDAGACAPAAQHIVQALDPCVAYQIELL